MTTRTALCNVGIGMIFVIVEFYAEAMARHMRTVAKLPAWVIGDVVEGNREVRWEVPDE